MCHRLNDLLVIQFGFCVKCIPPWMRRCGVLLPSLEPDYMPFLYPKADSIITNGPFSMFEAASKYFNIPPYHV